MANNTNLCTFTGTITRDPETRTIQSGKEVTNFSIAINKGPRDNQTTIFLNITAWEKLGGIVVDYAHKGDKILVSGELTHRKYTNSNGDEKEAWGLTANSVELLGGNRSNGSSKKQSTPHPQEVDDEIPF